MAKKMMIELDDRTFALLEVLAYGLSREQPDRYPVVNDPKNDDFAPMVRSLLADAANALAEGVCEPKGWEREFVGALTQWDGTFNRGMAASCIKDEMANWVTNSTETQS